MFRWALEGGAGVGMTIVSNHATAALPVSAARPTAVIFNSQKERQNEHNITPCPGDLACNITSGLQLNVVY